MTRAMTLVRQSLDGLSVGDALGQCCFGFGARHAVERTLPEAPWRWTDDTEMALSVVEVLEKRGEVVEDELAAGFVRRMRPWRGYAGGAVRWAEEVKAGAHWREAAGRLFGGQGSFGNGGAMRAAPIGAWFAGDPERAAAQAMRSAVVTHAHPEGQAGAAAVAAAAALVAGSGGVRGRELIEAVAGLTPAGRTREGIELAAKLDPEDGARAARMLGTGDAVSAQDTVPWTIFCAAHALAGGSGAGGGLGAGVYEEAFWRTAVGFGDVDTTCAIVGGIVAVVAAPPAEWVQMREPLDA